MSSRNYAKIFTAIWQSRKFRGLKNNDRARLLYMYLHTCPQVNSVGCFTLPIGYVVTDLGWSEVEASECLKDLKGVELIDWDEGEEMIRICGFIDHDPPTNLKHAGSMKAAARSLHDGSLKRAVLEELLRQKHCLNDDDLAGMMDSLSRPSVKPLVLTLPVPVPEPVPNPHPLHPSPAGEPVDDGDDGFDEFFQAMPKQENRQDAKAAYRIARAGTQAATILAGARRYASACRGRKPQHVSPPAVWLSKERWTDGTTGPPVKESAFNSPEELAAQAKAKEKYLGEKATH